MANSVNPDQPAPLKLPDLGLHGMLWPVYLILV